MLANTIWAQLPTRENVTELYVATFNRAPDSAGLDYWLYDSGLQLEGIARSFFDQQETQELYPEGYDNRNFVKQVYLNLFNREPDSAGWDYWEEELDSGRIPKSEFILAVMNGALGDDAAILHNKEEVGEYFAQNGLNDTELAKDVMGKIVSDYASVETAKEEIDINSLLNGNEDKKDNSTPLDTNEEEKGNSASTNTDEDEKDNSISSDTPEVPSGWSEDEAKAFEYLNKIRKSLGLPIFKADSSLHLAASKHAHYLSANGKYGHYESSSDIGYFGYAPSDRAINAGYSSTNVSENVATPSNYKKNVDSLMTAIYHRLGFLTFSLDEIGIGESKENGYSAYIYDMGNNNLEQLCKNGSTEPPNGRYMYGVCANEDIKIPHDEYLKALQVSDRKYVLYPKGEIDIGFFNSESPYPIPGYNFSGNPVSIFFNPNVVDCSKIELETFTLKDVSSAEKIDILVSMNMNNDPNGHFSSCDFAFFPAKREEFGHSYEALLRYSDTEGEHEVRWNFSISSPGDANSEILTIVGDDITFDVESGKDYYLYLPPTQDTPSISSYSYSIMGASIDSTDFYDSNTLHVRISGDSDDAATFEIMGHEVTLKIR